MGTYTYTECRNVTQPIYGPTVNMSDRSKAPVRRSFTSPLLPQGTYEIRVRRVLAESASEYVADTVAVSDINEIIVDDVAYTNTALVGVKIQLSDQLSGVPKVTYLNHGRLIRVWNGTEFVYQVSDNPAWITLDMLTHQRYGGQIADERIDMVKWKEWAEYCDEKELTFNGVIDNQTNLWDAMQYVFRAGHAQIVNIGTRYSVVIEKADVAVQMFSVANIMKGTFKQNWLPLTERANQIEVNYYDKDDNYKQNTVKVYDPVALQSGAPMRGATVTLVGVDTKEKAHKEAVFQLNLNRYILQTVEFSAPIEAIAATVGDVIYVQHDMPQWGYGGRLKADNSTSVLKLDRPVPMAPGTSYKVLVFFDAVQRVSGTITSITGNSVLLAGFAGGTNVKRLKSGTLDKNISEVYQSGADYGVVLDDVTGLVVGQPYTLWDTNVIEERDVVNGVVSSTEVTEVVVTSPFSTTPGQYTNWMYGPVDKVKKPFRIRSIGGSHEYHRDIVALEYNESVYDLDSIPVPTANFSNLDTTVSHVTISEVTENLVFVTGALRSEVTVHFSSNQDTYRNAKVYVSKNDEQFEYLGMFHNRAQIEADTGDLIVFKVVATDMVGVSAPETTAPTITHTVVGKSAPPTDITGFGFEHLATGTRLYWVAATDIDFGNYEIRLGADWDSGTVVYEGTDPQFVHPLLAAGAYNFHIKAVDTSGNYSANVTTLAVTINAPGAVTLSGSAAGENYNLTWDALNGSYPTRYYIVKRGGSWVGGTLLANHDSTKFTAKADWSGSQMFWVAAVDVAGNEGTPTSVNVTINAPSAPTVNVSFLGENAIVTWTTPASTLSIKEYEVRYGTSYGSGTSVGRVQGDRLVLKAEWLGARTFWVAAVDIADNLGTAGSGSATINAAGAPGVSQQIVALKSQISWDVPAGGTLPIAEYELRYGASFASGASITFTQAQTYRVPIDWTGPRTFWVAAYDTAGNLSAAGSVTVEINVPEAPDVSVSLTGTDYKVTWVPGASTLPIEEYEIRYGASYAGGTTLGRVKGTTFNGVVNWGGTRTFWVASYDQNGNVSVASSASLNIALPLTPTVSFQVVDNNVLLQWTDAISSLPIQGYEVRKGNVFASATVIGTVGGRFTTIFETVAGTYSYWVVGIDSAGNRGVQAQAVATVANPPDYILFDQMESDLDSTSRSNVTRTRPNQHCIDLDGATQYATTPANSGDPLDIDASPITMEAWIKPNVATNNQGIFDRGVASVNGYGMKIQNANQRINLGSHGGSNFDSTGATIKSGEWVHVIGVINGASSAIYINGVASGTGTVNLVASNDPFEIGRIQTAAGVWGSYFGGEIGPCRVYSRAIDATEADEHYRGIYDDNTGLVAAWNFNEGEGIVVKDSSDNANDLALVSSPEWLPTTLDGRIDLTETRAIYYPVDNNQTFADHFVDASASTHQDLITAGNVHGMTPAPAAAQYAEVIDYGTVIPSTKISVTANHETVVGTVTITPKISIKEDWSDPWTDFNGVYSVFATNFRYVKVTLDFSSAGGNHVGRTLEVSVTLDVKLINDSGTANCSSSDSGGTTVTFNVPFIDVNSITVTPAGTSPVIANYDFSDVPNPTEFKILLFDRATGARVSGLASWSAKGV